MIIFASLGLHKGASTQPLPPPQSTKIPWETLFLQILCVSTLKVHFPPCCVSLPAAHWLCTHFKAKLLHQQWSFVNTALSRKRSGNLKKMHQHISMWLIKGMWSSFHLFLFICGSSVDQLHAHGPCHADVLYHV